jgi:hypothetical protein
VAEPLEPLQDQRAGSTVKSVSGTTAIDRSSLTKGLVCLNTSIQPQKQPKMAEYEGKGH